MGSPIIFRGKTLDELRAVTGQHQTFSKYLIVSALSVSILMDHLLFPFCLTWFGHIAIGWDGAELLGDICLPWHCWTIVKSLPRGDSAVATESGNRRVWSGQEVEGDAWGLIDVAVHDCFLHFLLVCLEETDWYFLTIFV